MSNVFISERAAMRAGLDMIRRGKASTVTLRRFTGRAGDGRWVETGWHVLLFDQNGVFVSAL